MPKVVQIRDVPDDVHRALSEAAAEQGLSLTRFVLRELEAVAARARIAADNAAVVRNTQHTVDANVGRAAILAAIDEARA